MANNIVNNWSSTIITILTDVVKTYERNLEIIKQAEDELNDLYHEIELSAPKDMYKCWLVYIAIKDARIRRRTAKEENELLQDWYAYSKDPQAEGFKRKLQSIQGNSVKIRTAQEQRTYQPRQRNDLTITDKHSTANKPFENMLKEFNKTKVTMKNGKMRK